MSPDKKVIKKTNEQYLSEFQEGKISNLHHTPYSNLSILFEARDVDDSYKDEDGDWIHSTKTVVDRKAFVKCENGKYAFLIDNWFDDIDDFTIGLYAKVRLGCFCNLVTPLGEYLFHNWFGEIEFHGNNLIYCYAPSKAIAPYYHGAVIKAQPKPERACSIYNKRGQLLLEGVIVKTPFEYGESVITKDGLYNYINADGKLLMEEWLSDAHAFEKTENCIFAFAKTDSGWGVIDSNGAFIYPPQFLSIKRAEWSTPRYDNYYPLAIVEDDNGQNILMKGCESPTLTVGFLCKVYYIVLLGDASRILARQEREWGIFEWNRNKHRYDCSIGIGELDNVEDNLYQIQDKYYRLIKKGDVFNVVGTRGILFKEWYSEIVVIGNLFKVKRSIDISKEDTDEGKNEAKPPLNSNWLELIRKAAPGRNGGYNFFEYNLVKIDGSYILKEWSRNMVITPFQGAFLININPKLAQRYNGSLFDSGTITQNTSTDISSWISNKIQGSCNIILHRDLLFNTWYDGLEVLSGDILTGYYFKVWKDGKCNLINERGEYVSSEWMDDFLTSGNSCFSVLKDGAFEVKKDNKKNLLYKGKLVFNQWFTEIERHNEPRFSGGQSNLEAYDVQDGYKHGIYYMNSGLFGGRLYDSISRISETLFFSIFDNLGHIMSLDGNILTTAPMFEVSEFKDGYAIVTNNETVQYNFINSDGQIVSPVWFDEIYTSFGYSNDKQPSFTQVRKDSKYNLITPDKKLAFKKWYDSISGDDGRWLISDESRGELKFNFIDNNEKPLSDEWFKSARPLRNLDKGIFVVENEAGYNVFNNDNIITLSKWTKGRICDDYSSGLAVVVEYSEGENYYYLDHSGQQITPYMSYENSVKRYYHYNTDCNEELLIIDIHSLGGYMQIICKSDGTPYFKKDARRSRFIRHSKEDNLSKSIFGSIEEYAVSGKESLLLVNKHWPVKYGDIGQYVIIDYKGKELSEGFESISKFDEDGYAVVKRNGVFNLIDKDFRLLSSLWFSNLGYEYKSQETEYEDYLDDETGMVEYRDYQVEKIRRDTSFHDGYLKIELLGSFNLINKTGMVQFPIWYDSLIVLSYGFYKVGLNGLFNIVDTSNKTVSDIWFDKIVVCKREYDKTIYACKKGELYKLLFLKESTVIISDVWIDKVFKYDKSDGYYSVRLKGRKNFITDDGKLLMPGWHEEQLLFRDYNGVYVVVKDSNKFNIFSSNKSKLLSDEGFDNVLRYTGGLFRYGYCGVEIDGKYTFVNEDGELTEGRYDSIREFCCGFAGVVLDGKKNFLSSDGKLLTDIWFEEISAFTNFGKAAVKIDGKLNIIDSMGNLLLPDDIQPVSAIEWIESEYCSLSIAGEEGRTINKYFDFQTSHLHDSESSVKDYLETFKTDSAKMNNNGESNNINDDNVEGNSNVAKRNQQIRQLIENSGKTGINYTLVRFGDKSNLVDKTGSLLFEEWIDSSSIQMYQGIPLMMETDNKWIIVN